MTLLYILFCIFILPITQSIETNISVRILLSNHENAATLDLDLTLWWNHGVYECKIYPWSNGGIYWCDQSQWTLIGESCHNLEREYKMMLDNTDSVNSAIIDSITLGFSDRPTWYEIAGWCLRNDSVPNGYSIEPSWEWTGSANHCQSGYHRNFNILCIDSDSGDCAPGKRMMYFDINSPNETRYDSPLDDASNVTVDLTTCDPTIAPAKIPTSPSHTPTSDPSTMRPTKGLESARIDAGTSTETTFIYFNEDDTAVSGSVFEVILIIAAVLMVVCVLSSLFFLIKCRKRRDPREMDSEKDRKELMESVKQRNAVIEYTNSEEDAIEMGHTPGNDHLELAHSQNIVPHFEPGKNDENVNNALRNDSIAGIHVMESKGNRNDQVDDKPDHIDQPHVVSQKDNIAENRHKVADEVVGTHVVQTQKDPETKYM